MSEYSYNDIMKMQNAAIRRVNEMQKKAKEVAESFVDTADENSAAKNNQGTTTLKRVKMPNDYLEELKGFAATSSYFEDSEPTPSKPELKNDFSKNTVSEADNANSKKEKGFLNEVFSELNLDSDKTLLLSLVLLLAEEKADETLILSLLYMLI